MITGNLFANVARELPHEQIVDSRSTFSACLHMCDYARKMGLHLLGPR
jgi:hypothetical protein